MSTPQENFKNAAANRNGPEQDQEEDLWVGGYSGKAMLGGWIAGGVVSVGLIIASFMFPPAMWILLGCVLLVWVGLACTLFYKKLSVHYELTDQRFIHKSGILKRVTDRIEVIDIDDVTYEQGIVQRMMGVGKIRISSSDRTHPELVLAGINDVARIADMIDDVRRAERRRRGVHIETI